MTNLECVVAVLAAHREARRWNDDVVAADMLERLMLKPGDTVGTDSEAPLPEVDLANVTEADVQKAEDAAIAAVGRLQAMANALRQRDGEPGKDLWIEDAQQQAVSNQANAENQSQDASSAANNENAEQVATQQAAQAADPPAEEREPAPLTEAPPVPVLP